MYCFNFQPCPTHEAKQAQPSLSHAPLCSPQFVQPESKQPQSLNQSDAILSDLAFRAQFDPEHPSYHKGDTTAVPASNDWQEKRVPESMPGPAVVIAEEEEPEDYGEEYDAIMRERLDLTEMKRAMNVVTRCIGIMLTDLTNAGFRQEKDAAVLAVQELEVRFAAESEWRGVIADFVKLANGETTDLANNIALLNTSVTRKIGFEQKRQLARIKEIKTEKKNSINNA